MAIYEYRYGHLPKVEETVRRNTQTYTPRAPIYVPGMYATGTDRRLVNCYGYAAGTLISARLHPHAETSDASYVPGSSYSVFTPQSLHRNVCDDGLQVADEESLSRPVQDRYLVAAYYCVTNPADYHFARLNLGGLWSHKGGETEPATLEHLPFQMTDTEDGETYRLLGLYWLRPIQFQPRIRSWEWAINTAGFASLPGFAYDPRPF